MKVAHYYKSNELEENSDIETLESKGWYISLRNTNIPKNLNASRG